MIVISARCGDFLFLKIFKKFGENSFLCISNIKQLTPYQKSVDGPIGNKITSCPNLNTAPLS